MQEIISTAKETALFPLTINVLPGAYLPLQIFEPRYIDMVKDCLSKEKGFCIVLIKEEKELSTLKAQHSATGTYVEVVDFNQLENGLLGITVQGKYRAQILDRREQDDGLLLGNIVQSKEADDICLEADYENIWRVLREISEHPEIKKLQFEIDFSSSSSVAYNLASLLPISPLDKQLILESNSNQIRLDSLQEILKKLGG
ncbi:MAG: Lon protease-like protein [Bacteriovoracaceae bacterium]|jgi:Lon protease-like protein|tara:strand:+ start:1348 stop:1950 length:603 start_codon:yes stop_codon:yes gene_type:complete